MPAPFHLFGLVHLIILATVLLLAALLAALQRKLPPGTRGLRYLLACLLFLSWAAYYASFAFHGQRMFPDHVPLELCDASLGLLILALLTLKPAFFDLAYYFGLAGASQSLLTPNLAPDASPFLFIQFFLDHGLIVSAILYLAWSRQARPRPRSVLRSMIALNLYAAFVGAFDAVFKTDYMFLRAKPVTPSALDLLGPWPWYILSCEAVALVFFLLLYLPFRRQASPAPIPDAPSVCG